jgi:peptide/nickel transport system substrate-binding protein
MAQAAICREIQTIAFATVPYLPNGLYLQKTAYRSNLTNMQKGLPVFYGVQRA